MLNGTLRKLEREFAFLALGELETLIILERKLLFLDGHSNEGLDRG